MRKQYFAILGLFWLSCSHGADPAPSTADAIPPGFYQKVLRANRLPATMSFTCSDYSKNKDKPEKLHGKRVYYADFKKIAASTKWIGESYDDIKKQKLFELTAKDGFLFVYVRLRDWNGEMNFGTSYPEQTAMSRYTVHGKAQYGDILVAGWGTLLAYHISLDDTVQDIIEKKIPFQLGELPGQVGKYATISTTGRDNIPVVLFFDLETGALRANLHFRYVPEKTPSSGVFFHDFIEKNGTLFPMVVTARTFSSSRETRSVVDKESLKIDEPIVDSIFNLKVSYGDDLRGDTFGIRKIEGLPNLIESEEMPIKDIDKLIEETSK